MEIIWYVAILAFFLASMDSIAGMGFGTGLAPLLFLLGYNHLQIVPALLISQTISGLISAYFDHEFENISFSFKPLNDATRYALLFALIGCIATFFSIFIAYFAFNIPENIIKVYVAFLIIIMGFIGILKLFMKTDQTNERIFRPKLLLGFSAVAGFNKGISGGGYGPIITLGQIFSGVYEKSARAIVALAEALVSITGTITFIIISLNKIEIDLILLPSIFTGAFFGALISPYLVRVMPNKLWKRVIPIYAIILGVITIIFI